MPELLSCPSLPELHEFLLGQVPEQDADLLQQHFKQCPPCLSALHSMKGEDTLVVAMRGQANNDQGTDDRVVEELMARLGGLNPVAAAGMTVDFAAGETAETRETDSAPPVVAGYEILGVLGRGGMGVVYRARHIVLKRIVALKMISAGSHAGPGARVRFKVEAESIARLQHPHVVQIYEVGDADGLPYCALEYVNGGSLAQKLGGTPLPPEQAAAVVETLARAMHAAHQQGVIHRDLKPANILLQIADRRLQIDKASEPSDPSDKSAIGNLPSAIPKITDFGLARNLDEAGQTQTGSIMGTPSYMAPEQAEGRAHAIGPAADIYALGAILYECLTGRPPFRAATTMDTLHQVIRDEPVPPRQLQSRTPRDLETICLKCLHKEPGKRYASALDLALDLRRYQNQEPIQARPVGRIERSIRWCRRHPGAAIGTAAAALFFLVGTSVSIYYGIEADQKADLAGQKQREAELREREANWNDYAGRLPLLGRALEDGNFGRLEQLMEKAEARPGLRPFRGWEWAYLREQCQQASRELKGTAPYRGTTAWCRTTGRIAAATQDRTIDIWDPSTSNVERTLPAGNSPVIRVAWRPDGKRLAASYEDREARIWDAISGKLLHTLKGHITHEQGLAWSHDGARLASGGYEGLLKVWDASDGRLLQTLSANRGKGPLEIMHVYGLSWHPDGVRIAAAHRYGELIVWNTRTAKPEFVRRGFNRTVAWSPDGKHLAAGTSATIAIFNEKGDEVNTLRDYPGGYSLRWSPDGTRLAAGAQDHSVRVWDVRTAELIDTLRVHHGHVLTLDWSPAGDRILSGSGAARYGVGPLRIAAVDAPAAPATTLHIKRKGHLTGLSWSPGGERLAIVGGLGQGIAEIWDARAGKQLVRLALMPYTSHDAVSWSPNGRAVAVAGYHNIWVCDAVTGKLMRTLFEQPTAGIQTVAWSPDGRWLATANYVADTLVWDTSSWKVIAKVNDGLPFKELSWSPDSTFLAAGNSGGNLRLWDVSQRKTLWTAKIGSRALSWSPDGRLFASLSAGMHIFDARNGNIVHAFASHIAPTDVRWSPDGRRIATSASDGVRIYDAATADLLLTLPSKGFVADRLAWSPSSRRLAAVCSDGAVRLWGSADIESMTAEALETGLLARAAREPPGATSLTAESPSWPIEKFFHELTVTKTGPEAAAGKPFVIVRGSHASNAGYGNLAEAVKASKSGDIIEVRGNGPFVTPAVNAGKKALVIRAGAGFEPVLLIDAKSLDANLPLLASNGRLSLEGLHFRHVEDAPRKETFYNLIRCQGAPLSVTHCRFSVTSKRLATALACWNSPRSEVRHCEFAGNSHGAITWGGLTSFNELEIADCLCWGPNHFVFFDHYPPAVPRDIALRMYRNTAVGFSALLHYYLRLPEPPPTGDPRLLRIDARENVFDAGVVFGAVVHAAGKFQPEVDQPLLPRCFSWHDDKNLYAGSLLQLRHHPNKYVDAIKTLPDWQTYWRQGDTGSRLGRPRYQGGDIRAKKTSSPENLTAADFRLYPGGDGQGAGANGRNLGVDVDNVGPGKAYERWRKSPEYRQWLSDSGRAK